MEGLTMKIKLNELPSVEIINELFTLDAEKGILYWKPRPLNHFNNPHEYSGWNTRFANTVAGSLITKDLTKDNTHYRRVRVNGKDYKLHRLIFKMYYKQEPEFIDHINGDPKDNRPINLRSVTAHENSKNRAIGKRNTSGFLGIKKIKDFWQVRNKDIRILFKTLEEAIECKQKWNEDNGYHLNHGRKKIAQ
jgi:hypothetical protein